MSDWQDWQKRFETYLKADGVGVRILEKLVKSGLPRQQVLSALDASTDSRTGARLRKSLDRYIPTKLQNKKLAALCSKLRNELEHTYGSPIGICFPQADEMLRLAGVLKSTAGALTSVNNSKVLSRLTEKYFWKGLPLAVLCVELGVPKMLSWDDLCPLYAIGCQAHGMFTHHPEPRSLEAKLRRFKKRNPGFLEVAKLLAEIHSGRYLRHESHPQKSAFA